MKYSKEDLIAKVNDKIEDVDLAIELIEDITDSMEEKTVDQAEVDALKTKVDELNWQLSDVKEKYKQRFLGVTEEDPEKDPVPELEAKDVIDIKEI